MANMTHTDDWEYGRVHEVTSFADPRTALKGSRKPRLHSAQHTGLMTVTRANGDTYTVSGTKRRAPSNKRRSAVRTVTTPTMSYADRVARFGADNQIY